MGNVCLPMEPVTVVEVSSSATASGHPHHRGHYTSTSGYNNSSNYDSRSSMHLSSRVSSQMKGDNSDYNRADHEEGDGDIGKTAAEKHDESIFDAFNNDMDERFGSNFLKFKQDNNNSNENTGADDENTEEVEESTHSKEDGEGEKHSTASSSNEEHSNEKKKNESRKKKLTKKYNKNRIENASTRKRSISFKWSEQYMLGILFIDRQHKRLVELIVDLSSNKKKMAKQGVERWHVGHILDELLQYTKIHFKDEEHMMDMYEYPYRKPHKKVHADFVKKVSQAREDFINDQHAQLAEELLQFLQEWLVSHILRIDKRLVEYVEEKDPQLEKLKGASAITHM
eukprot:gb/GECH01013754.1/.p1 GENE.gb/GECH01013754.1/~~gb/GECH01013754.1/.p1  ORF type:complete len:341 (+),score=99.33 gb/GECH01013754.1/:1-1023(+)